MNRNTELTFILGIIGSSLLFMTSSFANQLNNGDFETNPPSSGYGNHIGHSISPWVLGSGDSSNVIKTSQGLNSTGQGPLKDATSAPAGTQRHYLDIADGSNDFYQTFVSSCNGEATFGGYFSTRANKPGTASVTLRNGTGTTGSVVGQSNPVSLPSGDSVNDPWTLVTYTAPVVAGNTYSLIVSMDNNMNFDEAFVEVEGCNGDGDGGLVVTDDIGVAVNLNDTILNDMVIDEPVDNCCPPVNKDSIIRQLTPVFQPNGGSNAKYRLNFSATSQFNNQMQSYLNYANSMQPAINALISKWTIYDKGPGPYGSPVPTSPGWGTNIDAFFTTYHVTNPKNLGNTSSAYTMKPNNWYRVQVGTYLNDGQKFFSEKCESSDYWVNWQVGGNKSSGSTGEFVISDGKKEIARVKSQSVSKTSPLMKAQPIKRETMFKRF